MYTDIEIFKNEEFGTVRTVLISGEPWFVGKDIASALGYGAGKSLANAVAKHVDGEDKGVTELMTPGGKQKMTIINESGLYALIFGSKLESAKRFKRWVTSEVLPAIRKNGTYSMAEKQPLEIVRSSINQTLEIIDGAMEKERQRQIGRMKYLIDVELEKELGETQSIAAIFTLLSNAGKQNVRMAMGRTVKFLG